MPVENSRSWIVPQEARLPARGEETTEPHCDAVAPGNADVDNQNGAVEVSVRGAAGAAAPFRHASISLTIGPEIRTITVCPLTD